MRIGLITEGTYPCHMGGVSVWCDQLVRGLPEHDFHVVALTATGAEPPIWDLPRHVSLSLLPLWGPVEQTSNDRVGYDAEFAQIHDGFLNVLLAPDRYGPAAFTAMLRAFSIYAEEADLGAALRSEASFGRLIRAWDRLGPRAPRSSSEQLTLGDALVVTDLLEHFLRPLSAPPARADVVHATGNGLGILVGLRSKWLMRIPFILTEHGIYLRERYLEAHKQAQRQPVKTIVLQFFKLLTSAGYVEADLIVSGSEYNRRWLERNGAHRDDIRTVYSGIDPATFPEARREPDEPVLAWVGRIDPIKDLETAIRAFALVNQSMPNARLRIFGPTAKGAESYRDRCEALIRELGLADRATIEGVVPNVGDAYGSGQVVLLSSISEGFPYTVIEAMTMGRPVVATDVGGVGEAIGDTGHLVPPRDPQAMANACIDLLAGQPQRRAMGRAARERARDLFGLDGFLDTFRDLYSEIGGRSPSLRMRSMLGAAG